MLRDLPLLLLDLLRLLPFLLLLLPPCSHQPASGSWQATTSHKCVVPSPLTAHIPSHTGSRQHTVHMQQAAHHTQAAGSIQQMAPVCESTPSPTIPRSLTPTLWHHTLGGGGKGPPPPSTSSITSTHFHIQWEPLARGSPNSRAPLGVLQHFHYDGQVG